MIPGPLGARHDAVLVLAREELAKAAALYFDAVIPLYTDRVPKEVLAWGAPSAWQRNASLLHAKFRHKIGAKQNAKLRVHTPTGKTHIISSTDSEDDDNVLAALLETTYVHNREQFQERVVQDLSDAAFTHTPLMLPSSVAAEGSKHTEAAISINLRGIKLVDVDRLSWEEIIHVRDDPVAMRGLRAIRNLFDSAEESDQSRAAEEVSLALDKYKAAARSHGLPMIESEFGVVVAIEGDVAKLQSNLPALVFGHPATRISLSRTGALKKVAGVELGVVPARSAFKLLTRSHPLVFTTSVQHGPGVEAIEH